MVLEFCDGGDLAEKIKMWAKEPSIFWPQPSDVLDIFIKMVRGVDHMHVKGIAHLDLKPGNILVSQDLNIVKVCDLGLSNATTSRGTKDISGFHGTPGYIAPEVWRWQDEESHPDRYSTRADVWSLACILTDMMLPNSLGGWAIEEEAHRIRRIEYLPPGKELDSGDDNWPGYALAGPDRYHVVIDLIRAIPRLMEDRIVADILRNCLQADPDKRWPSCFLIQTLEQALGELKDLVERVNSPGLVSRAYSWAPGYIRVDKSGVPGECSSPKRLENRAVTTTNASRDGAPAEKGGLLVK